MRIYLFVELEQVTRELRSLYNMESDDIQRCSRLNIVRCGGICHSDGVKVSPLPWDIKYFLARVKKRRLANEN